MNYEHLSFLAQISGHELVNRSTNGQEAIFRRQMIDHVFHMRKVNHGLIFNQGISLFIIDMFCPSTFYVKRTSIFKDNIQNWSNLTIGMKLYRWTLILPWSFTAITANQIAILLALLVEKCALD